MHLKAAKRLSVEDLYGAMVSFENIWAEDPLDAYVFHMAYFMVWLLAHFKSRISYTLACVFKEYRPGMLVYVYVQLFIENLLKLSS